MALDFEEPSDDDEDSNEFLRVENFDAREGWIRMRCGHCGMPNDLDLNDFTKTGSYMRDCEVCRGRLYITVARSPSGHLIWMLEIKPADDEPKF